jgi:uncharacterized protein YkwD
MHKIFRIFLTAFLLLLPLSSASGQEQENFIAEAITIERELDSGAPRLNFSGCTRSDVSPVNAAYEQQVMELVNQERWNNGQLPPLKRNPLLDLAARYHAKDMLDDNYFKHDSYDGTTLVCAWSTRITNWYAGWNSLAENIAWGYGSPASVMSGWMNSSGHRANILSTGNREIGIGYYTGSRWVQDFGRKSAVYPLVINREAAQTDAYQVSLNVYGTDTFTQMRFKNDDDVWGAWMPFASTLSWNLRQIKGTRMVTVELKKSDGSTTSSSDDIYLTNGAELNVLPASILFVYDQSTGLYHPPLAAFQPQNSGGTMPLTWSADGTDAWVNLSQASGNSPDGTTQVSIVGLDTSTPGLFTSTVRFEATNPAGTLNSPVDIPVQVKVVSDLSQKIFLPLARR